MSNNKIKIILADDHPLLIDGIKNALDKFEQTEVIKTFSTATEILENIADFPADVLFLDVQFPDKNANDIIANILNIQPDLKIIILSSISSTFYIKDLLKKGCMGYLLKDNTQAHFLWQAIETVMQNKVHLDADLKEELFLQFIDHKPSEDSPIPLLTDREIEVLHLIAEEKTNQEIADAMFLSSRTVENHRQSLLQKFKAKNSIGIIKAAYKYKLL